MSCDACGRLINEYNQPKSSGPLLTTSYENNTLPHIAVGRVMIRWATTLKFGHP